MANEMILIIDADTKSQKVLEVSFKKAGYRVAIVDSLTEAYDRIAEDAPALIITDATLPDGDGLELCADLKLDPNTEEIPLIFLTKDRSLTKKMRAFELGADDYLTKPIYIKEVTTRAELLIQRREQQRLSESDVEEFEGDLSDITMIDLLQTIEQESRSGSLRIHRSGRQAALYFRNGEILDAVCGKLQGEDAVYRVMLWPAGQFVVNYHENIRRADHIGRDTSQLLMEGMRRLEEWNDLITTLPALDSVFEADYRRLPPVLEHLPSEVERLVRLFDGYRKLRDVIDDSPVDDITTLQIIKKLLNDDLLRDVTASAQGETASNSQSEPQANLEAWLGDIPNRRSKPEDPDTDTDSKEQSESPSADADRPGEEPGDKADDEEIDTEELPRDGDDAPTPEEHREPSAGGGHWKFHWGDDRASRPRNSSTRTIESHSVSREQPESEERPTDSPPDVPPPESQGQSQPDDKSPDEKAKLDEPSEPEIPADDPDSLEKGLAALERQELLRREEEARQLAQQTSESDHRDGESDLQNAETQDDKPTTDETPRPRQSTPPSSPVLVTKIGGHDDQSERDEKDDEDIGAKNSVGGATTDSSDEFSGAASAAAVQDEIPTGRLSASEVLEASEVEPLAPDDGHSDDSEDEKESENIEEEPTSEAERDTAFQENTPTNKIGIPDEIKELRDQKKEEQEESQQSQSEDLIPDTDEMEVATDDEISDDEISDDEDLFDDKKQEDVDLFGDEIDTDEPSSSPAATDGSHGSAGELHPSFDESTVESTDEYPPPEIFPNPEHLTERNAKNGEIVTTEYDLSQSPSAPIPALDESDSDDSKSEKSDNDANDADAQGEDVAANKTESQPEDTVEIEANDEPDDADNTDKEGDDLDDKTEQSDESPETAQEENAEDESKTDSEAIEKHSGDDGESDETSSEDDAIHQFGDDFEEDLNLGSKGWRGPVVVVAAATILAIVLAAIIFIDDPDDETELAVADEPDDTIIDEETELVELPEEPEESDEAEEFDDPDELEEEFAGLNSEEAQEFALQKGISAEIAAFDITEVLDERQREEEEPTEEEPTEVASDELAALEDPQAQSAQAVTDDPDPVAEEPAPEEETESEEPEPEEPSLADQIQRLQSLVDQERSTEALQLASTLTNQAPDNRDVAYLHGRAALDSGRFAQAVDHLNRAQSLGYSASSLYLDLATAYQLTGQIDEACQTYESFLEVESDGSRADEVRGILERQC